MCCVSTYVGFSVRSIHIPFVSTFSVCIPSKHDSKGLHGKVFLQSCPIMKKTCVRSQDISRSLGSKWCHDVPPTAGGAADREL